MDAPPVETQWTNQPCAEARARGDISPAARSGGSLAETLGGPLGLGIDVGGTGTRWALACGERLLAQGREPAFSTLQLADAEGLAVVDGLLQRVANQVRAHWAAPASAGSRVHIAVRAGVTGCDDAAAATLATSLVRAFAAQGIGAAPSAVLVRNDIEMLCRSAFALGAGLVLVAGTGSIAACVDGQGEFHRAGGRGVLIDDAGGGHWIAVQALREVWRAEDASPGVWQGSAMAQALFARLGGSDWAHTRTVVTTATRGQIGELALAVAEAARAGDAQATSLLHRAGQELARPVLALWSRQGQRPVALAGRVFDLGPQVEAGLRAALPADALLHRLPQPAEVASALRAVLDLPTPASNA